MNNLLRSYLIANSPCLNFVRFRTGEFGKSPRHHDTSKRAVQRIGHEPHNHDRGMLPRLKGDIGPLKTIPREFKPNPWSKKAALFGQNDYIDILGDGTIHPVDLLTHVPKWLRGHRCEDEWQMLMLRRQSHTHWRWMRPKKWEQITKAIDYLWKYKNYKSKPRTHYSY